MNLQLTTKEQALTLKELNFDWETEYSWLSTSDFLEFTIQKDGTYHNYWLCYRPTVALTLKFMREKYKIGIQTPVDMKTDGTLIYTCEIYKLREDCIVWIFNGVYNSVEEAESAGLDKLIEIAKQNSN